MMMKTKEGRQQTTNASRRRWCGSALCCRLPSVVCCLITAFFVFGFSVFCGSLPLTAAPLAEAVSADGHYRAVLSVSPDRPFLSDTITLTLDVTGPDGATVEFPPFGEMMGALTIVDIQMSPQRLVLTTVPQRSGKTPIWAMTITCGQQRIDIPETELDILTTIDPHAASLDDIGLATELIRVRSWYLYALVALLVLVAALIFLWLFFKRKKVESSEEPSPLSIQELALRRLADLLESRKHESDVKGFFVELTDIVRWYVERLTGIRAPELTTEEFLDKIARPAHRSWQQPTRLGSSLETLVPFLESADIVKFAKHVPTLDEIMLAFRRAEQFVQSTAQSTTENEGDSQVTAMKNE